jgi:tRNA pseudouridine38-40 synthase
MMGFILAEYLQLWYLLLKSSARLRRSENSTRLEMGGQRNIRLALEYDGGGYHGWQIQPKVLTIQQVLEESIERITQQPSRVTAAGRTDAGVHALQQVVHFKTLSALPVAILQRGLNAILPKDIRVLSVDDVNGDFHARFSAGWKRYEYRIWNDRPSSAFQNRYAWWIPSPLNRQAMEEASRDLVGVHDFTSFRASDCDGRHPVREILGCGWRGEGPLLSFWIEANAFLRHMVRAIVGTLVEMGLGRRSPGEMTGILDAKKRETAGMTAPPGGLFLVVVFYPPPWTIPTAGSRKPLTISDFGLRNEMRRE